MEALLRELLPKLLGTITFQIYTYQCKTDLLDKLPQRLRGYGAFLPPSWRVIVLLDRDDDDCIQLKQQMEAAASGTGLFTKSNVTADGLYSIVNRIVVEELEAWYFGDWRAVRSAYPRVNVNIPLKAPYRRSDEISGGTWEAFARIARNAGYFRGGLRKVEAARAIGAHLEIDGSSSPSFNVFRSAISEICSSI